MATSGNTLTNAQQFASRRAQAERNIKSHIDTVLSETAADIAKEAQGITLVSSEAMFSQMVGIRTASIIEAAEDEINRYIREYSKASITILGDKDTGATGRLLNSELFGKTFTERSHTYMRYFFNDVIKMLVAGRKLKMSQLAIEKTVQSQYQDPYTNGIIDQANRKGANIQIPAYGRGIYHSAYGNIVRNAQGTISIAWQKEEANYAKRNGAQYFIPHRGSSYNCPLCDSHAERVHKVGDKNDPPPVYHSRCQCWVTYLNSEGQQII